MRRAVVARGMSARRSTLAGLETTTYEEKAVDRNVKRYIATGDVVDVEAASGSKGCGIKRSASAETAPRVYSPPYATAANMAYPVAHTEKM